MDMTRYSFDSILSQESFSTWYHGGHYLPDLVQDAHGIINRAKDTLDKDSPRDCSLFQLLNAMLTYAPTPEGQRYVASVLLAITRTNEAVVTAAKAWLTNLFYPMLTISKQRTPIQSEQTPTFVDTAIVVETANRREQRALHDKVFERERSVCPVTGLLHMNVADDRLVPRGALCAAHIIPLALNGENILLSDMSITWDMLRSWTSLDIETLAGAKINDSTNAICMELSTHVAFGNFSFYFDGSVYPEPNKYRIRSIKPNHYLPLIMTREKDYTFNNDPYPPPNPKLLAIHAAFCWVLHASGAAEQIDRIMRDTEKMTVLSPDGSTDIGSYVASRAMHITVQ
ncbi:hypothetical protein VNI00_013402 [Paramarasmius palmivorus]|uniref:HNH nuclease domain-containing protein n=1 Tax=Paramarasmius palmivorus TaxID=297713 RepID=A0AAW0BZ56_9AGAR